MWLIVLALASMYSCYRWGKWQNWKAYYPTILFYIIADFNHMILTEKNHLWEIQASFWIDTSADYFISLAIAPFIIILFLSYYPKGIWKEAAYISAYVVIMTVIEYIALLQDGIAYFNGWNIVWTLFLYIAAFPLLIFHYRRPLWAWLVFAVLNGIIVFSFGLELNNLK